MPKVSGIFRTLSLFFAAVEGTVEAPFAPFCFSLFTPSSLPHHSLITHSSLTHSFTPSLHYLDLQLLLVS